MRTAQLLRRATVAWLLLLAAFYAATTLLVIANFSWRTPMFDQFRLYAYYLTLPFPENALQLENGHRPIVPALARLFEIWCCQANQLVQIWLGAGLAAAASAALGWLAWRERRLPVLLRAGCVLVAVLGILWLGNARMLIHGNESVHAYLVVASVLAACWLAARASASHGIGPLTTSAVFCLIATFSFGTGIAAFPAAILVALLSGVRARRLWPIIAGGGIALVAYLLLLPGDDSVRGQLELRPLENLATALSWLASPWVHGWLVAGDPGFQAWLTQAVSSVALVGEGLGMSAGPVLAWSGGGIAGIGTAARVLGAAGVLCWVWLSCLLWRDRHETFRLEWVAFGLCSFAMASAMLTSLARLRHFEASPGQVFADRYLVWPSLFWMALLLLILVRVWRVLPRWSGPVAAVVTFALAVALYPSHCALAGWSAATHRSAERSIAAAWLGTRFNAFPREPDATPTQVETTLRAMEARHLGAFADAPPVQPGERVAWDETAPARCGFTRVVDEQPGANPTVQLEGFCPQAPADRGRWLLVVSESDATVRGLARWSWIHPGASGLRLATAHKRGYDGYVLGYRRGERYLVLASVADGGLVPVGVLDPVDQH